jgi:hypothetical protein
MVFVRQVDVLSRAVKISADVQAPKFRAAFSSCAVESGVFLFGAISSAQRDATEFHWIS